MSEQQHILESIDAFSNEVSAKLQHLRKETEHLDAEQTFWRKLRQYIADGWHLNLVALMTNESQYISSRRETNNNAVNELGELFREAQDECEKIIRRFPGKIEEAFRDISPKIDRNSQHPRYYFGEGFFQLTIDDKKRTAKLTDYEGVLGEVPADIGAVVEMIQREYKRVFERSFEPNKVLAKLRHQYLAVVKKSNQTDGSIVPIRSITQRLGKNEKGFRTDEFLYDLSRLVNENQTEIEGVKLDLQQTKDTNQGMLLHGLAGRGYVGFITFRKN
jgi:hypothetical protein